jgi:lysyl-tRNA synthetase, class II
MYRISFFLIKKCIKMTDKKDQIPHVENGVETKSNEHEIRLAKIKKFQEEGIKPWPSYKPVSATAEQAILEFEKSKSEEKKYDLAGRLIVIRDHGKTFFAKLQDRTGRIQLYIKKNILGDEPFDVFKQDIDVGDIIWVHGSLFTTKTGEPTLRVEELLLLSKCLHPLPEKFHGLVDVEQRYRQRHLDLISNPESKEKFKKRSGIVSAIRHFLEEKDFIEVETPMLQPIPGGAAARPFITHHNAYDIDLYMRIAPELYLKRLVVGGFERVFEINRNFRNEGVSTKHNPEFTMLEYYMAHGDYKSGMELTEELIQHVAQENFGSLKIDFQEKTLDFTAPFKKLTLEQSLLEIGNLTKEQISEKNVDATIAKYSVKIPGNPTYGEKLFVLFEECVEEKIVQPTFVIGYPIETSPLAKRDPNNPSIAARFELFVVGMELANGFTELNDPIDQAERFKQQADSRKAGDQEAHHYDADYVNVLEYGLPPTVGVGIGIDRLTMLLTNTNSIKDVILFPTLKPIIKK